MSRIKFDHAAGEALAQAVRDIEKESDAEIVIVVRGRSGTYRHADYLCGAIVALIGLVFASWTSNHQLSEKSKSGLAVSVGAMALLYVAVAAANYTGRLFG